MATLEQVAATRTAGLVTAREEAQGFAEPEQFAAQCGLFADRGIYHEISRDEALAVLQAILHRDMAYQAEVMPHADAEELAKSVLAVYMASSDRYFTNGDFGKLRPNPNVGPGWNPATHSTFDTGVLVLASNKSMCFWVQDED
jgi:hypothetical protein